MDVAQLDNPNAIERSWECTEGDFLLVDCQVVGVEKPFPNNAEWHNCAAPCNRLERMAAQWIGSMSLLGSPLRKPPTNRVEQPS
jgi:hypothetical protein